MKVVGFSAKEGHSAAQSYDYKKKRCNVLNRLGINPFVTAMNKCVKLQKKKKI